MTPEAQKDEIAFYLSVQDEQATDDELQAILATLAGELESQSAQVAPVASTEATEQGLVAKGEKSSSILNVEINLDRTQMEAAIEQFFDGKTKEDVLLLYFSGHGDRGLRRPEQQDPAGLHESPRAGFLGFNCRLHDFRWRNGSRVGQRGEGIQGIQPNGI